jgi:hypothetical protein
MHVANAPIELLQRILSCLAIALHLTFEFMELVAPLRFLRASVRVV